KGREVPGTLSGRLLQPRWCCDQPRSSTGAASRRMGCEKAQPAPVAAPQLPPPQPLGPLLDLPPLDCDRGRGFGLAIQGVAGHVGADLVGGLAFGFGHGYSLVTLVRRVYPTRSKEAASFVGRLSHSLHRSSWSLSTSSRASHP